MKKTFAFLGTLLSLTGVLAAQTEEKPQGIIQIGGILPLSGHIYKFGMDTQNGMKMAQEEINAQGGVLGKSLKIIFEDDEANGEKAIARYRSLVKTNKVSFILGALTSRCTLALAPLAKKDGVLLITPTSTNDILNDYIGTVFRACFADSFQGRIMANFTYKTLGFKKIGLLVNESSEFSKLQGAQFHNTFEALGGKVIQVNYSDTTRAFQPGDLQVLKDAQVQGVFFPDYFHNVHPLSKSLRDQGITVPLVGSNTFEEFHSISNSALADSYFSQHFSAASSEPLTKKFVKDYQARFNSVPNSFAALGYDSVKILAQAFTMANSTDPQKVRGALFKVQGSFVTGDLRYISEGFIEKSAVVSKLIDDQGILKIEYLTTVKP